MSNTQRFIIDYYELSKLVRAAWYDVNYEPILHRFIEEHSLCLGKSQAIRFNSDLQRLMADEIITDTHKALINKLNEVSKTATNGCDIMIDFSELKLLLTACWVGHLGSSTIQKCINNWYQLLTLAERKELFDIFTAKLTQDVTEIQSRFLARFDAKNQYYITFEHGGTSGGAKAYKFEDKYFTNISTYIPEGIIKIAKKIRK